uniref:ATP-binding protein n=1 Tax=Streptomyces sp. CRN 30 TaxID=3075613 RepID=UPI002A807124
MIRPLCERDDTHALITAETARARAGAGRLVLLRGATGTGRTAALEAAAEHAADQGMRVLRVHCSPQEREVPFAAVRHCLSRVPEFTGAGPGGAGWVPGAVGEGASDASAGVAAGGPSGSGVPSAGVPSGSGVPAVGVPSGSGVPSAGVPVFGDEERRTAARLWRLLVDHAAESPVMVTVDDVHLADAASRRWLVEAARRVGSLPVLIVATERSQYDIEPEPAGLTHALPRSLVRTHILAPLGDPAAAELLRAAFPEAGPEWIEECVRAGAGSPLLLRALLDDLGGTPPRRLPQSVPETTAALYPGAYPAAVSWWLESAGQATADVARALATLEQAWPAATTDAGFLGSQDPVAPLTDASASHRSPDPAASPADDPVPLLAEATGTDPARVAGWLTAMTRLGWLRAGGAGPRYAHPLLRDAVVAGWPTARRQQAHR